MKRHLYALLTLLLVSGLSAGCGTTPRSNHYLLTSGAGELPTGDSPSIGVGPVKVPEYLNRDALVYRRSHNQLQISNEERWAEPLQDGIVRVLGLNLAAQLDTGNVQSFPFHTRRRPDIGVRLHVLRLDAEASSARLVAEWLLYRPATGEALERRLVTLEAAIDPQQDLPAQMPVAYSTLLWELSGEIAGRIRALQEPG